MYIPIPHSSALFARPAVNNAAWDTPQTERPRRLMSLDYQLTTLTVVPTLTNLYNCASAHTGRFTHP